MTVYHRDDSVVLHHGDCLDVLAAMIAESVDAIVTDPPYGLEFMGKDWDRFGRPQGPGYTEPPRWTPDHMGKGFDQLPNHYESGAPFQDWCRQWGEAVLRVAKPGAHLLAFGGTRTHHRLYCGLEDAGWEIRDTLAWLYGCLSDDTEILTAEGWKAHDEVAVGDQAASFDCHTGRLRWERVQHVHRYDHRGSMVRLQSDVTDQLVTLNHRIVLEANRSTPHAPYVPGEQDLRSLLADVSGTRSLPVAPQQGVLAGVPRSAHLAVQDRQEPRAASRTEGPAGLLRSLRNTSVEARRVAATDRAADVLAEMQRHDARRRTGQALPQRSRSLGRGRRAVVSREDVGREQPGVEGWRYVVQDAWQLLGGALREGTGVGEADGAQGRLHHGAPAPDGSAVRVSVRAPRGRQPREPRSVRQQAVQLDTLAVERLPQALRVGEADRGRILPGTPVAASRVDYAGVVWCVTVPSGAFVARRRGQIFVTGNSGFPKSHDVSKAIDKQAGAEREVVGRRTDGRYKYGFSERAKKAMGAGLAENGDYTGHVGDMGEVTAPATDDARRWQGYGTALKPAHEPILLARKPLSGTVATNVLRHGAGALNIDGCRIGPGHDNGRGRDGETSAENRYHERGAVNIAATPGPRGGAPLGRWPANVVLDEAAAAMLDAQTGTLTSGSRTAGVRTGMGYHGANGDGGPAVEANSGGASRFFYVAKAPTSEKPWQQQGQVDTETTTHPTVKPLDLMRWLVRLVTPPGGVILDPFAGTGTTAEAAVIEGFRCVLIEQDEGYCDLARRRLTKPIQPTLGL